MYLRLYERAIENLAEQRTQFIAVHSALHDYRNGVLYDSSSAESEKRNSFAFYKASAKLQLPGVYVPPDIATEIGTIKDTYDALKVTIFQAGKSSDKVARKEEINSCDQEADKIFHQILDLINRWKKRLLHANNINDLLDAILDQDTRPKSASTDAVSRNAGI